ncbi:tRNA 2-selenouridine(34) synthase MnmH [Microaerobacter geothermalis]|uniref:tRNA 2-selenouridine(34) synthase MnmH n=1 Tax=Microaerobacter geothermalis TaxID=674972 RepID=UPI001F47203E|nr:tRNA 2-selenouridine(34) synthase MnmH [Microaerobacter geothermalis]MCF6094146.1 tRNA 2-selenouridine(34) synthase MnmH [Microaerobacter geothermalis]
MNKEIDIEQAIHLNHILWVDVRSPEEFNGATIPGAVNLPIFSDEERKQVGTAYKQVGPDAARWMAMELVSPKIPYFMKRLKEWLDEGKQPVVFCWRGGMRSKSMVTFADLAGLPVYRLTGGYRRYRQVILDKLTAELLPPHVIVLHGMTGVGKTKILHKLEQRGNPVIDLEGLANHRGSAFGSIGLGKPNNQKTFDALLFEKLSRIKDSLYVIIEAESKRIGHIHLPDFIMDAKRTGIHLMLEAPIAKRVKRIIEQYMGNEAGGEHFKERVTESFRVIQKRLPAEVQKEAKGAIEQMNYHKLVEILLIYYYDPRYDYCTQQYGGAFIHIDVTEMDEGVKKIEQIIEERIPIPVS